MSGMHGDRVTSRRWTQIVSTLLQNSYLAFPWSKNIYQGKLKYVCTPGLNCYSCPAAVLSCPIGALQHFLAGVRSAVRFGTYQIGLHILGFLMAIGFLGGRFPCGWLCPFGFFQEILHKIPSPKFLVPKFLRHCRYIVLFVFVVFLPMLQFSPIKYGEAWFCGYICPAGTLESGGLFLLMPELIAQIGMTFIVKASILFFVISWSIMSFRPYCQTLCPLGAVYGFFNRWSLLQIEYDQSTCTDCRACVDGCRFDLDPRRETLSSSCYRCLGCAVNSCPTGALAVNFGKEIYRRKECAQPSIPVS